MILLPHADIIRPVVSNSQEFNTSYKSCDTFFFFLKHTHVDGQLYEFYILLAGVKRGKDDKSLSKRQRVREMFKKMDLRYREKLKIF